MESEQYNDDFDISMLEDIFNEDNEKTENSEKKSMTKNSFLEDIANLETAALSSKEDAFSLFKKNVKRVAHGVPNKSPGTGQSSNSLIHQGDTDSSDDEDNKYFLESKYTDYGKEVKNILQHKERNKKNILGGASPENNKKAWVKLSHTYEKIETSKPNHVNKSDIYTEPVFGMKLIKPQIASNVIKERMVGRTPVLLANLKKFTETQDLKNIDWVTGGVIIAKSIKTSQKGNQYCIWNITDLHGDIKTFCIFLFGKAYTDLWKTSIGTIVGILNPTILESKENTKHEVTLQVDNSQRVLIFGMSKDIGICKSKKKSGEKCLNIVNLSRCEYCIYHIQKEYKKASTRLELQSSCAGRGLDNLRNKVLGKNEVFYGGKSFVSIPAKKNSKQMKKDNETLKKLGVPSTQTLSAKNNYLQKEKDHNILSRLDSAATSLPKANSNPVLPFTQLDTTPIQTISIKNNYLQKEKDHKLLSRFDCGTTSLSTECNSNTVLPFKQMSTTPIQSAKNNYLQKEKDNHILSRLDSTTSPLQTVSNVTTLKTVTETKQLLQKDIMIDLDVPISKKRTQLAKLNAINYVKQNGKINPTQEKVKSAEKRKEAIKQSLEEPENKISKKLKADTDIKDGKELIKEKLNRSGITDKFLELMKSGSTNQQLIEEAESEQREKYFNKLEIREKMEEKMLSTYKIECKAVRCLKCNYKSFSASDLCKSENHPLKVVNAIKRFWKCGDCETRTVCLELVPLYSCKNCGSSKWIKTTMMKEKKDNNLVRPELSLRGHEETFIGSFIKGDVNLLVPE